MNKLKSINLQVYIMLIAIIVIMSFFSIATDGAYLSARNISNLLRQTSITGILAIGMVFVIISAEIDLSVGSLMGLLGGFAAISNVWWGWSLPVTVLVTLVIGLMIRAWNGWWVGLSKSTVLYCHPCWYVGISWYFSRYDERHNGIADQPRDDNDRARLLV